MTAEARISARDMTGRTFDQIAQKMRGIDRVSKSMNSSMVAAASRTAGAIGAIAGPAALGAIAVRGIQVFANLEKAAVRLGNTAGATDEQIKGAMQTFQRLGSTYGETAENVSAAAETYVAAGLDFDTSIKSLDATLRTAKASGADVNEIAQAGVSAVQNFKIPVEQIGQAFDAMAKGGKLGSFELRNMAREFPAIGAAVQRVGLTGQDGVNEVVGSLETIRKVTGSGEEAANRYLNLVQKIYLQETQKNFKKMGVDYLKEIDAARKKGVDAIQTTVDIVDRLTKGKSETQQQSIIGTLFNDMQAQQALQGLLQFREEWRKTVEQIRTSSAGTIDRDLGRVVATTSQRLDKLRANWDATMGHIGSGLATVLNPVLEGANKRFDEMEEKSKPTAVDPNYPFQMPEGWAPNGSGMFGIGWGPSSTTPADPAEEKRLVDAVEQARGELAWAKRLNPLWEPGMPKQRVAEAEEALRAWQVQWKRSRIATQQASAPPLPRGASNLFGFGPQGLPWSVANEAPFGGGVPVPGGPVPTLRPIDIGGGPSVKAELEGAVAVTNEVILRASPDFIANIISRVQASGANVTATNGPGSVGTSSPDAAAPPPRHVGRGDM